MFRCEGSLIEVFPLVCSRCTRSTKFVLFCSVSLKFLLLVTQASCYLNKLPKSFAPDDLILITDPMLGTGGTMMQVGASPRSRDHTPTLILLLCVRTPTLPPLRCPCRCCRRWLDAAPRPPTSGSWPWSPRRRPWSSCRRSTRVGDVVSMTR